MALVDWSIEGVAFGNCNCGYGCPCQFEDLPTHGHCRGLEVFRIEDGHFGDVSLTGLQAVLMYAWPGPIFEGNGQMQAIIDERADETQRDALVRVLHGEETVEEATHWWVFRAMSSTVHEPLFKPIEFEVDIEARKAHLKVPGVIESSGRPIKSPATGEDHRVLIEIPGGIEFTRAEIGSASTKATGAIELDLKDSYGQFNFLYHSTTGVVR